MHMRPSDYKPRRTPATPVGAIAAYVAVFAFMIYCIVQIIIAM